MSSKDMTNLELWQPLCLAELNPLCILVEVNMRNIFSEIVLNLDHCFRRCHLKLYLIWNSGGPCVQWSRTICAILVKGIIRNNSVTTFEFGPVVQEEMFSAAEPFVQF